MVLKDSSFLKKATPAGFLISLGIVFGDIGTSPLYVMKAIMGEAVISKNFVLGAISAVFWTLTFQTTLKYVILTLRADNNGEGGILSLYALVRKKKKWIVIPAIIGASTLLADGMITPPISVTSAIEGITILQPNIPVVPIVIVILSFVFFFQRFGTNLVGKSFGPIMVIWFGTLGILGLSQLIKYPEIIKALNPYYVFVFLKDFNGYWLLGAVFLCTTGADALYSDLGHCGRKNIQVSWTFVKICLLLNYMGQGAWLLNLSGSTLNGENPFYRIMPDWFLVPGIILATVATIIASQALITGSFTLVGEAVRLNIWPKVRTLFPTEERGQIYIPAVNLLLFVGCLFMVIFFQESEKMEAAYGLAITITMLNTTILLSFYLPTLKTGRIINIALVTLFILIELAFFSSNLSKFSEGGWISIMVAVILSSLMWIWFMGKRIKHTYIAYENIHSNIKLIEEVSNDETIPKFATNLVYLSSAETDGLIESSIIYSIVNKKPKRADVYYFIHVEFTDDPRTLEYKTEILSEGRIIKIVFILGFRIEPRLSVFFRKAIQDLMISGEVNIMSRYHSLAQYKIVGDFRFVVLERVYNYDPNLSPYKQLMLSLYSSLKALSISEGKAFGLDTSSVTIEKVPLVTYTKASKNVTLKRVNK